MGDNPRGRYSLHFHRGGASAAGVVSGVVVNGARKLGIVNHSSHVIVDKSIAYKFDGSGFFTETGNELGEFRNNLAIRTTNTVGTFAQEENGRRNSDFGFSGNGFWLQGGGVQMHGNAAYGVNNGVAVFQGFPLIENGSEVTLHRDSLPVPDPTAPERIHPGHFPFTITNQLVVGAAVGIGAHNKGARGIPYGRWSLVEDVDLIHVTVGIGLNYTTGINLNRIRAVGNVDAPAGRAFAGNFSELAVYYRDISAEGFMVGITAPWTGGFATDPYDLSVQGATLRCTVGVYLPPNPFGRVYRFEDVTFLPLDPSVLAGTDIYGFPPSLPAGEQFDFYYA